MSVSSGLLCIQSLANVTSLPSFYFLLGDSVAQASTGTGGVQLSGTCLIFDGAQDAASMNVTNALPKEVWLMRFWVSPYGDTAETEKNQDLPFAVTLLRDHVVQLHRDQCS